MKKAFLFLAVLLFVVTASAQTLIPVGTKTTQAATALATTTTYDYAVIGDLPYYMGWQIDLDSIAGTAAGLGCTFEIEGSHDGVVFFDVDTLTYVGVEGTSSDTTAYENNTSVMYWEYLRAKYTLTDTLRCGHTIVICPFISK